MMLLRRQASESWLASAENRLNSLATCSDNIRAVRIQLEQIKVAVTNY